MGKATSIMEVQHIVIKATLGGDLHRRTVRVGAQADGLWTLDALRLVLGEMLNLEPDVLSAQWKDEDGDLITLACDLDVVEAYSFAFLDSHPILRLSVVAGAPCSLEAQQPAEQEAPSDGSDSDDSDAEDAAAREARLAYEKETQDLAIPDYPHAPVPKAVAAGFLAALRREYLEHIPGAVGEYFEQEPCGLTADELDERLEEAYEQRVRDAEDVLSEIERIQSEWSAPPEYATGSDDHQDYVTTGDNQPEYSTGCDVPSAWARAVLELESMGFERKAAQEAVIEAKGNLTHAVEVIIRDLSEFGGDVHKSIKGSGLMSWVSSAIKQGRALGEQYRIPEHVGKFAQAAGQAACAAGEKAMQLNEHYKISQRVVDAAVRTGVTGKQMLARHRASESEGASAEGASAEGANQAAVQHVDVADMIDGISVDQPPIFSNTTEATDAWDSSWEHMLQELHEMGFVDKEANKQILISHHGDLKDAVRTLITNERLERSRQAKQ